MRKLVIGVIAVLAVFTFIREWSPQDKATGIQKAQISITATK